MQKIRYLDKLIDENGNWAKRWQRSCGVRCNKCQNGRRQLLAQRDTGSYLCQNLLRYLTAVSDILRSRRRLMSVVSELEQRAMSLTKMERGALASRLIASLGSPFEGDDEDEVELALKRSKEMDENPDMMMSEEQFWDSLKEFRRK